MPSQDYHPRQPRKGRPKRPEKLASFLDPAWEHVTRSSPKFWPMRVRGAEIIEGNADLLVNMLSLNPRDARIAEVKRNISRGIATFARHADFDAGEQNIALRLIRAVRAADAEKIKNIINLETCYWKVKTPEKP